MVKIWFIRDDMGSNDFVECSCIHTAQLIWDTLNKNPHYRMVSARP